MKAELKALVWSTAIFENGMEPEKVKVHELTSDWIAEEATWSSAFTGVPWYVSGGGGDYVPEPVAISTLPAYITDWDIFEVTETVQRQVSQPDSNFGFIFIADLCDEATAEKEFRYYYTSESMSPNAPILEITYDMGTSMEKSSISSFNSNIRVMSNGGKMNIFIPSDGAVTLKLYKTNGRVVMTKKMYGTAGENLINLSSNNLAGNFYLAAVEFGTERGIQRILLR